jgi:hypothetical protein
MKQKQQDAVKTSIKDATTLEERDADVSRSWSFKDLIWVNVDNRDEILFEVTNIHFGLFNIEYKGNPNYATVQFKITSRGFQCDSRIVERPEVPRLDFILKTFQGAPVWNFGKMYLGLGESWYEHYVECNHNQQFRYYEKGIDRNIFDEAHLCKIEPIDGWVHKCP